MRRELLIGCGSRRKKLLSRNGYEQFGALTTLDVNAAHNPDIEWDLERLPLPFDADSFDEIHAYEVLEHTGRQGDYKFFLAQFAEFWRILRHDGDLFATCPSVQSPWAWGDPGHTRIVAPQSLVFLSQVEYARQVGVTPMSDYRSVYRADFDITFSKDDGQTFSFALRAVKPSRGAHAQA